MLLFFLLILPLQNPYHLPTKKIQDSSGVKYFHPEHASLSPDVSYDLHPQTVILFESVRQY